MKFKIIYKSHFRVKKTFFKNKKKNIFIKNIIILFFFLKVFLKNFISNFLCLKNKKKYNLLKAPSRHKKFFHQISYDTFIIKIFFKSKTTMLFNNNNCYLMFFKLGKHILKDFGSNTLVKNKYEVTLNTKLILV